MEAIGFVILNQDSPTRCPSWGVKTSPDVSMISAHLGLAVSWKVESALQSDHLPITITFDDSKQAEGEKRCYVYLGKADWPKWREFIEVKLASCRAKRRVPKSYSKGIETFLRLTKQANKKFIPAGKRKNFIPQLPREAADQMRDRDVIRAADSADPRLADLNYRIDRNIESYI